MAANPTWFTLASVFVAVVALFGLGAMFMRATNVERNALVGGLTVLTAVIAAIILAVSGARSFTDWGLIIVCLFSVTGFFLGRGIDYMLGAKGPSRDTRKGTLGADLSD